MITSLRYLGFTQGVKMKYDVYAKAFESTEDKPFLDGKYLGRQVVMKDEVTGKELHFSMAIAANAPQGALYSVSKIFRYIGGEKHGQPVFIFLKQEGRRLRATMYDHYGSAFLIVHDGHRLDSVFGIQDLIDGTFAPMKVGDKIVPRLVSGGMSLEERQKVKAEIAADTGMEPLWTPGEYKLAEKAATARREAEAKEREEKRAAAEAKKQAAEQLRKEKVAALLKRPKLSAFTADGGKRHGIPIYEDGEDEILDDGALCIRCDADGLPIEAYIFRKKENGRIRRVNTVKVFATAELANSNSVDVTIQDVFVADFEGELLEVSLFSSLQAVEEMRVKHGLNSGTVVAVKSAEDKAILYKVTSNKSEMVGTVELA